MQETHTVIGIGSIIMDAPLQSNYPSGTAVLVYPPKTTTTPTPLAGNTSYKYNDPNVQYHDSIDPNANNLLMNGNNKYYQPGSYLFGASSYVPNYEDSVYLSNSTNYGSYVDPKNAATYKDATTMAKGPCEIYKDDPDKLEQACQNIDNNVCSSMSCCVLLGGSKCVAGNSYGPLKEANYSDAFIKNKDYYYFQGKCYGDCPR
jgi:hypothetical protein